MGMELSIIGASKNWPTCRALAELKRDEKSLAVMLREVARDLAAMFLKRSEWQQGPTFEILLWLPYFISAARD